MKTATLSQKYQIVVPLEVRKKMQLHTGSRVNIYPLDEKMAILITYPKNYVQALRGLGSDMWQKLGGARHYLRQEKNSWDKK